MREQRHSYAVCSQAARRLTNFSTQHLCVRVCVCVLKTPQRQDSKGYSKRRKLHHDEQYLTFQILVLDRIGSEKMWMCMPSSFLIL